MSDHKWTVGQRVEVVERWSSSIATITHVTKTGRATIDRQGLKFKPSGGQFGADSSSWHRVHIVPLTPEREAAIVTAKAWTRAYNKAADLWDKHQRKLTTEQLETLAGWLEAVKDAKP